MKNVIVFALGGERYAIELRWVREVITLGHVTPLPTAPTAIGGVVNVAGAVVPVIELMALVPREGDGKTDDLVQPRKGDGAVLVEVEGVTAAVRMHNVETVTTLNEAKLAGQLSDGRGGEVPLLDMPALIKRAHAMVVDEPGVASPGAAGDT